MKKQEDEIWELFLKGGDNRASTIAKKVLMSEQHVNNVIDSRLKEIEKRVSEKANRNHEYRLAKEKEQKEAFEKFKKNEK